MESVAPKVTVVVPTYNERDNLPKIVELLAASEIPNLHVLVVDDNSPDGTGEVADTLAQSGPIPVGVLHRTVKDGLGRAYVAGMTRALDEGADIVIQMDADLSHPHRGHSADGGDAGDDGRGRRARLPLRGRWRGRQRLALASQGAVGVGELLRQRDPAVARQGRHRRVQGVARGHLRASTSTVCRATGTRSRWR